MQHYPVPAMTTMDAPHAPCDGNLPVGLVTLDATGCVMSHNPLAQTLLGTLFSGALWRDVLAHALTPLPGDGGDYATKDGQVVRVSAMLHASGAETLVLTPLMMRASEHARAQRLRQLGEHLAVLMHQQRTPLTGALLSVAQLPTADTAGVLRIHARLNACLQNLQQQTEDTLRFARGETLVRVPVSLQTLCEHLEQLLQPLTQSRGVRLRIEQHAQGAHASLALEAFCGALANLVVNAMEANAREIVLTVERTPQYACVVQVQDDGDGMPESVRVQAFTPFYTTRAQGTGLGLALVGTVVCAHGGICTIVPDLRQGTCVVVKIP